METRSEKGGGRVVQKKEKVMAAVRIDEAWGASSVPTATPPSATAKASAKATAKKAAREVEEEDEMEVLRRRLDEEEEEDEEEENDKAARRRRREREEREREREAASKRCSAACDSVAEAVRREGEAAEKRWKVGIVVMGVICLLLLICAGAVSQAAKKMEFACSCIAWCTEAEGFAGRFYRK